MKKSDEKYLAEINKNGFVIIPSILPSNVVEKLWCELDAAMKEDLENCPDVFDAGMVHNCFGRGDSLRDILNNPALDAYIADLLGEHYIMYAYQSSSLPPNSKNYGSRIHVDSPRYIGDYQTNVGVIFPLTDFTEENGATWVLPTSHKKEVAPSEEDFHNSSERAICNAGDMIVFLGRVWHKAGTNRTSNIRHSITINFCRSYMRQRFDYPRMIDEATSNALNKQGKRLVGMNVRMPTSLEEFYLPEEERLYKPNQG